MFSPSKMFFAHENMKKPASKVAEPAQIHPKSQFLFHKNLPPWDLSLMTLIQTKAVMPELCPPWVRKVKKDQKPPGKKCYLDPK